MNGNQGGVMAPTAPCAAIVQIDKALESYRNAGYDLTAAAGELVDNSIDWGKASIVRIRPRWDENRKRIEKMAFADNGVGIPVDILSHVLSLGFSSGYGSRSGLGRFGVGLKLATLAITPRVDIYTKRSDSDAIWHTHLDLKEVKEGVQTRIEARECDEYPVEFADLMRDNDREYPSGTLIVWSRIDKLEEGGRYGQANRERLQELLRFLARAYRRFIDNGLQIELDGRQITLHDPLFLLPNPRVIERFGPDVNASIVDHGTLEIDGSRVEVTVALLPEVFRRHRGKGGRADRAGDEFSDLYIPYNEGKISFLRQGREINYDLVAKMLPGGKKEVDRFIGIEVSFPATLDEYFQVRNVKRGVVPVLKLREELRKFLDKPVRAARKEIRGHWTKVDTQESAAKPEHDAAEDAVDRAEESTPRGRAGEGLEPGEERRLLERLVEETLPEGASNEEKDAAIKRLEERHIPVLDGGWPGKELLEITHLNGKAVIRLNSQHPFVGGVYTDLGVLADRDATEVDGSEAIDLARRTKLAIDVLLMGYAKAENMSPHPEDAYGDLRSDWGRFTWTYLREALKEIDNLRTG
jgi:hypothetical protein